MYKHRQIGWLILILVPLVGIAPVGAYFGTGQPLLLIMFLVIALVLLSFATLSVQVDGEQIHASFTLPLLARKIKLGEVTAARPVRNKWWYGWGIRYLGSDGWMFNVHGLDAVELELTSGKKFRIGTDDPEGLTEAITSRIGN